MNEDQRAYDLEMARDADSEDLSPEQMKLLAQRSHANQLSQELRTAIDARRTSGVDDRLVQSHRVYEGQRDAEGNETFDSEVKVPKSAARAYFNIARQITNDGSAQLGDLLFPSDDRNYGLNPGPVSKPPLALRNEPAVDSKDEPLTDSEGNQLTNQQAHTRRVQRLQAKTERMFDKVDASLINARFPSKSRKVIKHAGIYGTGILKGPLPKKDGRGRWAKKTDGTYSLRKSNDRHPDVSAVHPMDFFPDLSGGSMDEGRFCWERTYMQPADLSHATKTHGFDRDVVQRLINAGNMPETSDTEDTREEAKTSQTGARISDGRFIVWERRGPISRDMLEQFDKTPPNDDDFFDGVVFMCQDEILKVVVSPYENTDSIYSVFVWDEDPLGIFGYGIPWLIQDAQRTYVAAWRMALDNGGLSAAPMVVVDKRLITPQDGDWTLHGGKVWLRTGETYANEAQNPPFDVVNITQNLNELWAMMDRAVDDAYELSGVTRVEKAQGGLDNAPVTLGATQIMQNNTTVSRRALARRWDDDVTLGLITRFYDFFMQFDTDPDAKGHMVVEPRGASVLLAKELQANNYMQLYNLTGGGQAEGVKPIPLLRAIAGVMQVPEGRFIETEDEVAMRQQAEQEQGDQPTPEQQLEIRKIEVEEARVELEQADLRLEAQKAEWAHELGMMKVQLQEIIQSANLSDRAQARADKLQESIIQLQTKTDADREKVFLNNRTQRDIAAAKVASDRPAREASAAAALKNADTKETEMNYKLTTGNDGV